MELNSYQEAAKVTAIYPDQGNILGLVYTGLGLSGEAGEVTNKLKKLLRDDDYIVTQDKRIEIATELGDVLWYVAQCATELGITLDSIAKDNLGKLQERMQLGKLKGSGDNR